jgi:hypothetical protein
VFIHIAINLWKEYTSYVVQEYKNGLNEMDEMDLENESEYTITLDQVRKIFDEANRETCYYTTEVNYFYKDLISHRTFTYSFYLEPSNMGCI